MEAIIFINVGRIILGILVGLAVGIIASKLFRPAKTRKISKYILNRKKYEDKTNEKTADITSFRSDKVE